ncbi:MAG: GDSL-type esterase/lipase family protein [Bacteroidia bacterium]
MKNKTYKNVLPWKSMLFLGFCITLLIACKSNPNTDNQSDAGTSSVEKEEVITAFAEDIEAFEKADQANFPPEGAALFVGSSSLRMWKTIEEDLAPFPVINRGFGGSTFKELNYYADRIVYPYKPKCVFVYEGDNDITKDEIGPTEVLEAFMKFHSDLKAKLPGTKVYFLSIKPSIRRENLLQKATETNRVVQQWALSQPDVDFVNVATAMMNDDGSIRSDIFIDDNLHMNATGYALWTPIVKAYLQKEFRDDSN